MSTWRALPPLRRLSVALFVLLMAAIAVQMYATADRVTQPATGGDDRLIEVEAPGRTAAPENEFLPANRDISECISAIPKPGCGSKARGGWRQTVVFLVILAGLAIIAWRVVASSRKARAAL